MGCRRILSNPPPANRNKFRACFKVVGGRRVRARGLQEMAKI